jgi:DNA-directed RNA polymerase subunit beta
VASHSLSRDRYSFANLGEALEIPDLIAVQRESFEWFVRQALSLPNQAISTDLCFDMRYTPFNLK